MVDATIGGGGHARAVLEAHPGLRLVGIDRDRTALAAAREALDGFGDRIIALRHGRFVDLQAIMSELSVSEVSGVLFDLGVSSPQLDTPERGFSYRHDGPLDMRMDQSDGFGAGDVVNGYSESRLAQVISLFGEERYAARIARAIVTARPIESTAELAEIVRNAIPAPARRRGGHPAKRTFQAIRIEINRELEQLPVALDASIGILRPRGRVAAISYHSGEDRIIKRRFRHAVTGGCACPRGLPCVCDAVRTVRLLMPGGVVPSATERQTNPRAESARLRAVEKLDEPQPTRETIATGRP